MSKVTYNVIYQVCGQVTTDIPEELDTEGEITITPDNNEE